MRTQIALIITLYLFSFPNSLLGQLASSEIRPVSRPQELLQVFNAHFPDQHSKKIVGRPYLNPYFSRDEHQFFLSKKPFSGILFTENDSIHCTDIQYNTWEDKIVIYSWILNEFVELEEEFIQRFILIEEDGKTSYEFIRAALEESESQLKESRFYQLQYSGENISMYKRHYKLYKEIPEERTFRITFKEYETLMFRMNNKVFKVKRNKDLLMYFPDHEAELRRYLRSSRLNIRSASDHQMSQLVKYLDENYSINDK